MALFLPAFSELFLFMSSVRCRGRLTSACFFYGTLRRVVWTWLGGLARTARHKTPAASMLPPYVDAGHVQHAAFGSTRSPGAACVAGLALLGHGFCKRTCVRPLLIIWLARRVLLRALERAADSGTTLHAVSC